MHAHIKPNLLSAKIPEKAVTTHPVIVTIIAEKLIDLGASVTIGDSPAGMSRSIHEYWEKTGMTQAAKKTGAKLVKLEKNGIVERIVRGKKYYIAKEIATADLVINVGKTKKRPIDKAKDINNVRINDPPSIFSSSSSA